MKVDNFYIFQFSMEEVYRQVIEYTDIELKVNLVRKIVELDLSVSKLQEVELYKQMQENLNYSEFLKKELREDILAKYKSEEYIVSKEQVRPEYLMELLFMINLLKECQVIFFQDSKYFKEILLKTYPEKECFSILDWLENRSKPFPYYTVCKLMNYTKRPFC